MIIRLLDRIFVSDYNDQILIYVYYWLMIGYY